MRKKTNEYKKSTMTKPKPELSNLPWTLIIDMYAKENGALMEFLTVDLE